VRCKIYLTALILLLCIPVFVRTTRAQENNTDQATAGPPKFLNMVHQELKPGRSGAYAELETSIARIYSRENIPVFWVELGSITGPAEVLYLNLFDSSEEMAKAMDALSTGLAAHPELVQMQDRLLQENTSNGTSVLGVRRDDMGYRANTIDFSKMRVLRLSTVFAHPGYERAFMETEWSLSEASNKVHRRRPARAIVRDRDPYAILTGHRWHIRGERVSKDNRGRRFGAAPARVGSNRLWHQRYSTICSGT
jgi:hypothetical protein